MKDFQTLIWLDKCSRLFERFNIDYTALRCILQMKFTMDARRVPTVFHDHKPKEGNQFLKSLWMYALISLMLIPFIVIGDAYFYQMSFMFSVLMFVAMLTMISDFSTVLLDVRDKTMLNTKPVNNRTITAAKAIHVMIYMSFVVGTLTVIPLLVGLFHHGIIFFLLFLIEIIFVSFFILIFTALIYLFVLRFFDGEKLRDMINYMQILLSFSIFIGYQLVARSFQFMDFQFSYTFEWWQLLIPPMWYGALYEMVLHQQWDVSLFVLSLLGLIIPIIAFIIYLKCIPSFERNMEKLMAESKGQRSKGRIAAFLATIVSKNRTERAFYQFANRMMNSEREFKLKVYPSIGMTLVIPFLFFFNEFSGESTFDLANSMFYMSIYFTLLTVPVGVSMIRFSAKYEGGWIYRVAPIQQKRDIYTATLKAILIKLFVPIFLLESVIFVMIFSSRIIFSLIIIALTAPIIAVITYLMIHGRRLPFTESYQGQQQSAMLVFPAMLFLGVFAMFHIILTNLNYGEWIYLFVLLIGNVIVWRLAFLRV
ncbi:hypothetical protein J416_06395 [Gracilibacillus halophilus YIM-C55.5]|uniref:Uncharacterized protein n=1 Tax=Gracilibacillus halophilus YIM-C55.5 TaxID=1308866 RepID=N4WD93_9BACI|nr:hypothetical protein [Gracilibacillus halophilus]ENH97244.1 hypothetical protein J416_06395 [Gracilibacillus halophilus YIM-C55.5]